MKRYYHLNRLGLHKGTLFSHLFQDAAIIQLLKRYLDVFVLS